MHLARIRRLVAITLAGAVILSLPGIVAAGHSWGSYHWARQSNPFTLKLGDNVSSAWDPYLATTSSDWGASSVLDTTIVAGGAARPKQCRATSGRVEVCNAKYGFNGWLGVAQIWASGSHITQGTVRVNDSYLGAAPYNSAAWRNLVMCQEVGHTLGLGHNDENFNNTPTGTCMDYSNDPVPNQHPNAHDYAQLESIYEHLDSTTTLSSAPAGSSAAGAGVAGFGRLVAMSHGGRVATYVLELGRGVTVISHVIWAR